MAKPPAAANATNAQRVFFVFRKRRLLTRNGDRLRELARSTESSSRAIVVYAISTRSHYFVLSRLVIQKSPLNLNLFHGIVNDNLGVFAVGLGGFNILALVLGQIRR